MLLLAMLQAEFLSKRSASQNKADTPTQDRWRSRYFAALDRIQASSIRTINNPSAGVELYVALRDRWDGYLTHLGASMLYDPEKIYPKGSDSPAQSRQETLDMRLRGAS